MGLVQESWDVQTSGFALQGWCCLGLAAAQGHLHILQHLVPGGAHLDPNQARHADLRRGFAGVEGALAVAEERGQDWVKTWQGINGRQISWVPKQTEREVSFWGLPV